MPVYFAHGFRWPRAGFTGVRVHIIFHNLEDCSAEYIQNAHSQASILASFRQTWPDLMKELDDEAHGGRGRGLTLLEEYDPEDEVSELAVSRPWAFVCDCVRVLPMGKDGALDETARGAEAAGKDKAVEGKEGAAATASVLKGPTLSMNVTELIAQGPGSTPKAWEALADLRDKIAEGEKIDWWVIYNGDPERAYSVTDESGYEDEESEDTGVAEGHGEQIPEVHQPRRKTLVPQEEAVRRPSPARPPQPEERLEQRPKSSSKSKGIMLPPIPPAKDRDKGKRTPGMTAFPPLDKAMPPLPPLPPLPTPAPVLKSPAKTESGLKKKLFGKK
jgi:hypothetical protein